MDVIYYLWCYVDFFSAIFFWGCVSFSVDAVCDCLSINSAL